MSQASAIRCVKRRFRLSLRGIAIAMIGLGLVYALMATLVRSYFAPSNPFGPDLSESDAQKQFDELMELIKRSAPPAKVGANKLELETAP